MNKYFVTIPYSYMRYGNLSCYVYAEDSEEAADLAYEYDNRYSEDFNDGDNDGDTEYDYFDMRVELDEEDVSVPNDSVSRTSDLEIPCRFIADIVLI